MISRWLNKHSLNFKLNISILTCVCFSFFALVYFISARIAPIIISQIDNLASKSVIEYTKDISHLAADTEQIVNTTKNTLSQTKENDVHALKTLLKSALKTTRHSELKYVEAWVYSFDAADVSKGVLYFSEQNADGTNRFHTQKVENFYDIFPWFKEVPKEEKIYWSEPYIDDETGNTVVTCLIPFTFEGETEFNGLVALTVDLSSIQENIYNYSFYEVGRLLLLSRSGLYVTHPDKNIALKMTIFELADKMKLPELAEAGKNMLSGKIGNTRIPYSSVYDGSAIFFYAPVKGLDWGLCLVYSQNELLKPLIKVQGMMAVALTIVVLLLAFLIGRICSKATGQLIGLSKLALKYGQGDFADSFEQTPSSSDIALLATAMSRMRANLLKYTEKERQEAAEQQKRKSELEIAFGIQKSSLSTKYPQHNCFDISTVMVPAREVGGDFYDFFFVDDDKFAIVIADVSGKGIPAAMFMMKAQTLIKNISKSKIGLDFVLYHVNDQLYEGNESCMFVTAFMAVIDLKTGEMKYVNAGHIPPMVGNANGLEFISPKKNIILGVKKNAAFAVQTLQLAPGDHVFLYTDGVTEAEDKNSKFYGTKRLQKVMQTPMRYAADNLEKIMHDIKKFVKDNVQSDDITMLDFVYFGDNRMILDAKNENLSQLIGFLQKNSEKYNMSPQKQFKLINAAEEIFANICDYAYAPKNNGKAEINTRFEDGVYYVEFSDSGKKYNPLKAKEPDLTAELAKRKIGGLGIYIAKKMADSISYVYKEKRNILTIGIKIAE